MKQKTDSRHFHAFTLVEMLVVISIIGVLAALLFPVGSAISRSGKLKRARAELSALETGIENYKLKLGFYPPDNPLPDPNNAAGDPLQGTPVVNQLYFELLGTVQNGSDFETLDGSARIPVANVQSYFGRASFSNLGARKGAEEGVMAENFLKGTIRPGQIAELSSGVKVFIGPVPWPSTLPALTMYPTAGLNPWRYVSSHPTNNTKSYDLWIDLVIGGKTNRISNWRKDPEILP